RGLDVGRGLDLVDQPGQPGVRTGPVPEGEEFVLARERRRTGHQDVLDIVQLERLLFLLTAGDRRPHACGHWLPFSVLCSFRVTRQAATALIASGRASPRTPP